MFEYTSDEKKKKERNEYSQATVYNPQGKLIHTHTPTHSHKRGERKGEKVREEQEIFQPRNKLSLFLYHKTTRRDECAPNLAVLQNHFINI